MKIKGLLSLGNTLKSLRVLNNRINENSKKVDIGAKDTLIAALQVATDLQDQAAADQIKMSLANTIELINDPGDEQLTAIKKYAEIKNTTSSPLLKAQADINLYRLQTKANSSANDLETISIVRANLDPMPPSHNTIYAYINLARAIQKNHPQGFQDQELVTQVGKLLTRAIEQAHTIKDSRGEAQALGALGNLYCITGQNKYAQTLTEQSLIIAESLPAPDLAYRLQWQLLILKIPSQLLKLIVKPLII